VARRIKTDPAKVVGLREHLIERCRAQVVRLEAANTEIYDFTAEVVRQRKRLDDLLDGADVLVYRHELGEYAPPRSDGQNVYTLRGDKLITLSISMW
jgi:hypothetical protein